MSIEELFVDLKSLKLKAIRFFKMSEATYPAKQRYAPEYRHLRLHHCENVKARNIYLL
jgi:hypothetical protein